MTIRNLDYLFKPRSVALIGGSRRQGAIGAVVARNLMSSGFDGPVLPVHPEARAIHGVLTYKSIAELPITPDLAVIATPPQTIPQIIGELGERGTRAAVVISAGFSEAGEDGKTLERRMLEAARPHLLRIVGPNCIGIAVPSHGLNASFAHTAPLRGEMALVSQSGAVLAAALDWAKTRGIGFSHMVSLGDKSDVDFGDMLDYLLSDTSTRAILLYVEAIRHARKFMSAARAAARVKPVIVIKSGRSASGARAASSHTGALAGEDIVYDAAFRRAGMLRVEGLGSLFAAVETLGRSFASKGDRLAILTNGGGVGVMATDALDEAGGRLASLSPETIEKLDAVLPRTWSGDNPVDIIGDADGERYRKSLEILLADRGVDATLVLNCPTALGSSVEAASALIGTLRGRRQPVLTCWLGEGAAQEARQHFAHAKIPTYATPGEAVDAFMQLVDYRRNQAELMQLPTSAHAEVAADHQSVREIIDRASGEGREWLSEVEAKAVLEAYDIPVVTTRACATPEAAAAAAAEIGGPVALKIISPDLTHKSDVGGVELDLRDPDEVRRSAQAMRERIQLLRPEARIEGFSVQMMIDLPDSLEILLGAKDDSVFGPVLVVGSGGKAVEILADTALALVPVNLDLARATMSRTRIWRLMQGYRGVPAVAIDDVARAMVTLGQIMIDQDRIAEIDINPLIADANGAWALDARMRLAPPRRHGVERLAIRPYPQELARPIRLRDGQELLSRPIRPEDAGALRRMIEASDIEDLRLRFFSAMRRLPPQMAARLTQIDYEREIAFVAYEEGSDEILGVSRLAADPDFEQAEYAILVRSDRKGEGLGYALMQLLIDYARARGIAAITGEVLSENGPMLQMCQTFGFDLRRHPGEGLVAVRLAVREAAEAGHSF